MVKILCVGDLLLDVTALIDREILSGVETRAKITTQGGGAAANVASWLAVNGVKSCVIARVGDDTAGRALLAELDLYGVEYVKRVVSEASTGVVMIVVDHNGERTMFPDSGANSGLSLDDLPDLRDFHTVYISGYCLINPQSRPGVIRIIEKVKERGLPIVFDPSTVGLMSEVGVKQTRDWLSLADLVILNEEEAQYLTGKEDVELAIDDLLEIAPLVVVKRGSNGAICKRRNDELLSAPAKSVNAVSTLGAGDAFAAGFIAIWSSGGSLSDSLQNGVEIAGQCVGLVGARPRS